MKRREFIAFAGCAAVAWPAGAWGQRMPVVGYLGLETADLYASRLQAFREGLATTGYAQGRNVAIEYRWAEGDYQRLPKLAADLVDQNVNVIVAPGGVPGALAAKNATSVIPIVFEMGADPVALALVQSLERPGGNITGATSLSGEVNPKRLELMHEVIPAGTLFGFLVNPTNPANAEPSTKLTMAAADALGLKLAILKASNEHDFDVAFSTLVQLQGAGMVISNDTFFVTRQQQLATMALRHGMPAISQSREFASAGGLMSYSGLYTETHRQAGVYTGRILKGEKPSELPVFRSTKLEFFLNLKTAKALGLIIPLALLGRADEIFE